MWKKKKMMPHDNVLQWEPQCFETTPDSRLHLIDRCVFALSVWIVGGGTDFSFVLMDSNS